MKSLCIPLLLSATCIVPLGCKGPNPHSQSQEPVQPIVTTPAPAGSVPAGSRLMVRTAQLIDSRAQGSGARFTAKLEADLAANDGVVVAKRGTNVYGQIAQAKQAGRLDGKSEMTILLTDIMIDNQLRPIQTSAVLAVTEGSGKSTVGRVGVGAAVGGIAKGSKGAKRGAAVGLASAALTTGNQINIPAGTLLEFILADHLVLQPAAPQEGADK